MINIYLKSNYSYIYPSPVFGLDNAGVLTYKLNDMK